MLLGERGGIRKEQMANLSKKYNTTGFMYTEYPHKSFWSLVFGDEGFRTALRSVFSSGKNTPLLLYVHIPFCEQLCWFCTCHMLITREYEKVKNYLTWLYREIDLLRKFFDENSITPNFCEVHLGGGSPTFVYEKEFDELIQKLQSLADLKNVDEFSIEIDPRKVDKNRMSYYRSKGINRISFGVQDFDLKVQEAINRVQPPELIENLLTPEIREWFENGVNIDLICGLPKQTSETIRKTCERVAQMSPDRICLNYLHYSPQFAPHQKIMFDGRKGRPSQLPDFFERKMIFLEALDVLTKKGYVRTGYDHFAKPTDAVAQAMQEGKMQWNALGVTAGRYSDVIGIGVHSYSTLGGYYAQNFYELLDYQAALANGRFPVYRGHHLTRDDLIRRTVIHTLRNFFFLDFRQMEKKYGIEFKKYFKDELLTLEEFVKDGIVELSDTSITLTELGHQFANLVCRDFDKFYNANKRARDFGEFFEEDETIPDTAADIQRLVGRPLSPPIRTGLKIRANPVTLSGGQIQFYNDNGFLVVPGLFDEEACEEIKRVAGTIAEEGHPVSLNLHRRIDLFLEIMKDPVLVSMVQTLQRHKVVGLNDQYLYKKCGTAYAKQTWSPHQDSAYVDVQYGTYMQLHIFLDPSDQGNGGLFYYPGSHKEDILPYEYAKSWKEEFDEHGVSHPGWRIKKIPLQYKRIDLIGPKGGICFQHGNLIHGSYPNLTKHRSREQYSIAYLNEGEPFLPGRASIKVPVALDR